MSFRLGQFSNPENHYLHRRSLGSLCSLLISADDAALVGCRDGRSRRARCPNAHRVLSVRSPGAVADHALDKLHAVKSGHVLPIYKHGATFGCETAEARGFMLKAADSLRIFREQRWQAS